MNWRDLPPLPALKAFAAYAQTGSMQRAGDALNVSHAAISQQIRNLERHLGVTLLDRTERQAQLTEEGQMLAHACHDGFERIIQAANALTGAEAARALHITTTPSFASGWLMPRLALFREKHDDIDLMIDANPGLRDPAPGGVDVAIRFGSGDWPGFDVELLVPTSIALVAAPQLLHGRPVTPETLAEMTWLQEVGTNEVSQWLAENGVTETRQGGLLELPGPLLLQALRAGQGVAVTAKAWVEDDIAAGRLALLHEEQRLQGYFLVTHPGIARPALRRFKSWIRRAAQQEKAGQDSAGR